MDRVYTFFFRQSRVPPPLAPSLFARNFTFPNEFERAVCWAPNENSLKSNVYTHVRFTCSSGELNFVGWNLFDGITNEI